MRSRSGEGSARRLEVGDGSEEIEVDVAADNGDDDVAALCSLFAKHFGLDPTPHFQAAARQSELDKDKKAKKTTRLC